MPKVDFEFYKFPNLPSEFVVPTPASDPYDGAFHPRNGGEAALSLLADNIMNSAKVALDISADVQRAAIAEIDGYFFNKFMPKGHKIVRQRATLSFPLVQGTHESTFYSDTMMAIAHGLSVGKAQMEGHFTDDEGQEADITTYRETTRYAPTDLRDLDGNHQHSRLSLPVRMITPVRAFRWLPGPERASESRGALPPTYSPRPVGVVFAQTVELVGLNPRAQDV